jgi:hypothetical protein
MYPVRFTDSSALLDVDGVGRCDFVIDRTRRVVFIDKTLPADDQLAAIREAMRAIESHPSAFAVVRLLAGHPTMDSPLSSSSSGAAPTPETPHLPGFGPE